MPFTSKSQMRKLYRDNPKVAEEFRRGMSDDSIKHLPERVSDLGRKPKPLRHTSDINVKKNVRSASMDIDKFVRGGVLERLIEDLQELEYDKKLKPKMVKLEMHSAQEAPKEEKVAPEEEEDDDEGMDPRLAKVIKSKRGK